MDMLSDEVLAFGVSFLYWSIHGIVNGHIDIFTILVFTFFSTIGLSFMMDFIVPQSLRRVTYIAICVLCGVSFFVNKTGTSSLP